MEIKKIDWYLMFCFLFIFAALSFFLLYYYVYHINACYADPLNFYAQKIKWEYGGAFKVYGTVQLVSGNIMNSLSFGEDKHNLTITFIENKEYKPQEIFIKNYYGNISEESRNKTNMDISFILNNS